MQNWYMHTYVRTTVYCLPLRMGPALWTDQRFLHKYPWGQLSLTISITKNKPSIPHIPILPHAIGGGLQSLLILQFNRYDDALNGRVHLAVHSQTGTALKWRNCFRTVCSSGARGRVQSTKRISVTLIYEDWEAECSSQPTDTEYAALPQLESVYCFQNFRVFLTIL